MTKTPLLVETLKTFITNLNLPYSVSISTYKDDHILIYNDIICKYIVIKGVSEYNINNVELIEVDPFDPDMLKNLKSILLKYT